MSEERLSYLSVISIEQQEARKIELDELITDFAKKNNFIELNAKLIPGFINEEFAWPTLNFLRSSREKIGKQEYLIQEETQLKPSDRFKEIAAASDGMG
ncbi:hypothetical protein TNCV_928971 [Trichonephila clavipes]|nr:hypothetical protein TNCV_928971 [Trichonephila clavipes]